MISLIQTHVFTFSLLKQVGEISDGKIKKIADNGFTLVNVIPGQIAQFTEMKTGNGLVIAQNQITCVPSINNADDYFANPEKVIETFVKIMDILMLDGNTILNIAIERSYETSRDTLETSLNLLSNKELITNIGSKAIGLRIPFLRDDIQGELKIEPFFSLPTRYFLACNCTTNKPSPLAEAEVIYKKMTKLIEEFEALAKNIFEG